MKTILRKAILSLVDYSWREVAHFSEVDNLYVVNRWPLLPKHATIMVLENDFVLATLAVEGVDKDESFALIVKMDFGNSSIQYICHTKDGVRRVRLGDARIFQIVTNVVNYVAWYLGYKEASDYMKLCLPFKEMVSLAIGPQPIITHPELN